MQSELWAEGIELESMGGDIPSVEVSGITGQGLDQLVETISALAELQDIRAEIDGPAHGYILESKVQKGLGYDSLCYRGDSPLIEETETPQLFCSFVESSLLHPTSSAAQRLQKYDN